MIYSGVDLIRRADQQHKKAEELTGPRAVAAVDTSGPGHQDPDPKGALLRFARFINKERQKKPVPKPSKNPYQALHQREQNRDDLGQMLNIYV